MVKRMATDTPEAIVESIAARFAASNTLTFRSFIYNRYTIYIIDNPAITHKASGIIQAVEYLDTAPLSF